MKQILLLAIFAITILSSCVKEDDATCTTCKNYTKTINLTTGEVTESEDYYDICQKTDAELDAMYTFTQHVENNVQYLVWTHICTKQNQ
jgi:PBP1b-binding outer membrane lipoprotein LpoB